MAATALLRRCLVSNRSARLLRSNSNISMAHQRSFADTPAKGGTFRTRITSFIFGVTLSGGVGAYLFYWNFNDVADQINEGIAELGIKFKKDTTKLYKQIDEMNARIVELEKQTSSGGSE